MVVAGRMLKNQDAHGMARALLAQLYREHVGGQMPQILVTERGKPYFAEGNVHFSISHTREHVFCVLSDKPVGIDAEEQDRQIRPELAKKILSPGELAQYEAAADKNRALLTFWVLKEAAAKCSGQGLQGYPRDTNFSLEDPRVFLQENCLVAVIENEC